MLSLSSYHITTFLALSIFIPKATIVIFGEFTNGKKITRKVGICKIKFGSSILGIETNPFPTTKDKDLLTILTFRLLEHGMMKII